MDAHLWWGIDEHRLRPPGGASSFPWGKLRRNEYDHELQVEDEGSVREGVKPLEVVQKEGPSFKVDGWGVEWQEWSFRVGFNVNPNPS